MINDISLTQIRKLYEEWTSLYGKQSVDFWKGWLAGIKTYNQTEIDSFLDELYNDVEQGKYEQQNGGLECPLVKKGK